MKNMDTTVKGTIAVVLIAIIVGFALYGSYFPMRKAQMFIGALQSFQAKPPTSINDLTGRIGTPLDYTSPIGQEELVRNTANSVLGFIQRGADVPTTAALMNFLRNYYEPIIAREKGMSFGQDIYLVGAVNEIAFANTGVPSYLDDALKFFSLGRRLGPNRPQSLYGLFDVYRAMGDATNTKMIAGEILANWPNDTRIQGSLAEFLKTRGAK